MRRLPDTYQNRKVHRERDPRALSRLGLLLFCGLVLASGFVLAAKQHFAAVQYGYTSEVLRRERDDLLREQQQLILLKEQASAPGRLETAARALGLKPLRAGQVGTANIKKQALSNDSRSQATSKVSVSKRR